MALSAEEAEPLNLLLKAQSKATVVNISREAFSHRGGKVPDEIVASAAKTLDLKPTEAIQLFQSLTQLIRRVLFEGLASSTDIAKLFPAKFHDNLRGLLSDIIAKSLPDWKAQVLKNQVSLPRLLDFDWRVDVKTASDSVAGMAAPTCLVQMKVQDVPTHTQQMVSVRNINVEFSKETLETMLDGLGKIRDQLSSVAKTS